MRSPLRVPWVRPQCREEIGGEMLVGFFFFFPFSFCFFFSFGEIRGKGERMVGSNLFGRLELTRKEKEERKEKNIPENQKNCNPLSHDYKKYIAKSPTQD